MTRPHHTATASTDGGSLTGAGGMAALETRQARFGHKVGAHLSLAAQMVPYSVGERLRAGREQALAAHRALASSQVVGQSNGAGLLAMGEGVGRWRHLVASALPVLALVGGLWLLDSYQSDASDVAEIDLAILKDQLPPSAYADAGFLEFLKSTKDD